MKALTDTIVNLGTAVMIIVASSLILAPHPDAFSWEVPNDVRVILLSITTLIALTNLTGRPKQLVHDHWDKKGFGQAFFAPWNGGGMTNEDRRFLVGMMESCAILLTLQPYPSVRGLGYAVLMVMYGRGALINARIDPAATVIAAGVSVTSLLLLKDEFYTVV